MTMLSLFSAAKTVADGVSELSQLAASYHDLKFRKAIVDLQRAVSALNDEIAAVRDENRATVDALLLE